MKISETIHLLEKAQKKYGDVRILIRPTKRLISECHYEITHVKIVNAGDVFIATDIDLT